MMADKLTDNEWAAGFLGWKPMSWSLGNVVADPTDENDAIAYFDVSKEPGTVAGSDENKCWFPEWRPDSDLNQFKLVLDKFIDWYRQLPRGSKGGTMGTLASEFRALAGGAYFCSLSIFEGRSWGNPPAALKAMRQAVEPDGPRGKEAE